MELGVCVFAVMVETCHLSVDFLVFQDMAEHFDYVSSFEEFFYRRECL